MEALSAATSAAQAPVQTHAGERGPALDDAGGDGGGVDSDFNDVTGGVDSDSNDVDGGVGGDVDLLSHYDGGGDDGGGDDPLSESLTDQSRCEDLQCFRRVGVHP